MTVKHQAKDFLEVKQGAKSNLFKCKEALCSTSILGAYKSATIASVDQSEDKEKRIPSKHSATTQREL